MRFRWTQAKRHSLVRFVRIAALGRAEGDVPGRTRKSPGTSRSLFGGGDLPVLGGESVGDGDAGVVPAAIGVLTMAHPWAELESRVG